MGVEPDKEEMEVEGALQDNVGSSRRLRSWHFIRRRESCCS